MANLNPKRQVFIDNKKQKETGPFGINGYFPLFDTKEGAISASPTPTENRSGENTYGYHVHDFDGTIFYMPNGLKLGVTRFHGDWDGQIISIDSPPTTLTPPQELSSKRRDFLSITGKLSDYTGLSISLESLYTKDYKKKKREKTVQYCKNDIVIAVDVSASVGQGGNYLHCPIIGNMVQAINNMISSIITGLTPQMNTGDLQIGICTWANTVEAQLLIQSNPGFVDHTRMLPTASGKWLSNDPVELDVVAQGIYGTGDTEIKDAFNISHEMLDKAITDFPNCSLGNRNGTNGFKRTTIIITDTPPPNLDSTQIALAQNNWQTEDIIVVRVNDHPDCNHVSLPASVLTYRTYLTPICGGSNTPPGGTIDLAFSGSKMQLPDIANDIVSMIGGACATWDCSGPPNYDCIDRYDGLGQYYDGPGSSGGIGTWSGLHHCNLDCGPSTWFCGEFFHPNDPNFVLGTPSACTEVTFAATNIWGFPVGPYNSLSQCQSICGLGNIPQSWDCVNGSCVDPGTGVGQYSTFYDCNANCVDPSWMCTSAGCIEMYTDPPQPYSSLSACQASCVPSTWDCTPTGCVDPGDGTGQYNSKSICDDECVHYECIPTSPSTSACVTKIGVPSGFSFPYPPNLYNTLVYCMGYCGGPLIYSGSTPPLVEEEETVPPPRRGTGY